MKGSRLLPYLAALLLLAWALGSLPRGQPGGSLLFNSYWLLYILYLLPVIALGIMMVMIVLILISWRSLSDSMGFVLAKRMRRRKPQTIRIVVFIAAWAFALSFLAIRCGGIPCKNNSPSTLAQTLQDQVVGSGAPSGQLPIALGGPVFTLTSIVESNWFAIAFLGLLIVSSVILGRSLKVAWDEAKEEASKLASMIQMEGVKAVQDAIKVLQDYESADPRMRIIGCYQRMIRAASDLGAHITSDQTARELESGIRRMFLLKGPGIEELTRLFEEARYSLHPMTKEDSQEAHECLLSIEEELKLQSSIQT